MLSCSLTEEYTPIYTIYISWVQNWVRRLLRWIKPFPGEFKEGWSNFDKYIYADTAICMKTVVILAHCKYVQWNYGVYTLQVFASYSPM